MDVTLLELHVSDAEFNAPFAGRSAEDESTAESAAEAAPDAATDRQPSKLAPVAALLALAGLALLARYLRGSGAEQTTLDEIEVE